MEGALPLLAMNLMRILRSHSLSVFAMLVLLLGTATPALACMTCVVSGASVFSIGQVDAYCTEGEDLGTSTIQATCCEIGQATPQHSAYLTAASTVLPMVPALLQTQPLFAIEEGMSVELTDKRCSRPYVLPRSRWLAVFGTYLI